MKLWNTVRIKENVSIRSLERDSNCKHYVKSNGLY